MGHECHVYGGHIESRVTTYFWDHLAATRDFVGYTGTPTPLLFLSGMHKP